MTKYRTIVTNARTGANRADQATASRENPHHQHRSNSHRLTAFARLVLHYTKRIPRGKVSTYKLIAVACGKPRAARAVGHALSLNPFNSVPCHRVIASDGTIGGFGGQRGYCEAVKKKARMIAAEGLEVQDNVVFDAVNRTECIVAVDSAPVPTADDLSDTALMA